MERDLRFYNIPSESLGKRMGIRNTKDVNILGENRLEEEKLKLSC